MYFLRYGWFSNTELVALNMQVPVVSDCMPKQSKVGVDNTNDQVMKLTSRPTPSTDNHSMELSEDCGTSLNRNCALTTTSTDLPNARDDSVYLNTSSEEPCEPTDNISWHGKDVGDGTVTRQLEDMVICILSFLVLTSMSPKVLLYIFIFYTKYLELSPYCMLS